MTQTNRFKIIVGSGPSDSRVELNGQPLEGVRRVHFDLDASKRDLLFLHLEIAAEVIVEGEYVERIISSTAD